MRKLLLLISLLTTSAGYGQTAAAPAPSAADDPQTTFRVTTNVVLVPTLVERGDGKILYGLHEDSFKLTDNGVLQKIHVDEDLDTTPVSMVVLLEKGRDSPLEFSKFEHLAPLLNLYLGNGNGEVKLMEFDSQVEYEGEWTKNTDDVQEDLNALRPGNGGAALIDASAYAIHVLEQRPVDRRRVLLLLSESRDHGSKYTSPRKLAEQIGASNTLVLSLTWSPIKAEFLDQLTNPGGYGLVGLIVLAANALKSNAAKSLAVISGGDAMSFTSERGFEQRMDEMASHARNRYMLSFHPTDLSTGLHRLQVQLTGNVDGRVVARTDYWPANQPSGDSN